MNTRERRTLLGAFLCAAALAGLCLWAVLAQAQPARVEAFANRFVDLAALGWRAPEGTTLTAEAERMEWTWPAGDAGLAATSATFALPVAGITGVQADVRAGGTQNLLNGADEGFRAWLTLELLRAGEVVASARQELLFASDKERLRLYSLTVPWKGAEGPDACRLAVTLEPVEGALTEGRLELAWVEVTPL